MSTPSISPPADRLLSFCQSFIQRHGGSWPPAEEAMAEEFVSFAGVAGFAGFDTLSRLCVQLGISVSVRAMPLELRGHNSSYDGTRTITIAEEQLFPGGKQHTLLHELRELLEQMFTHLGYAIATAPGDLEKRAEYFACLVRSSLAQKMMAYSWERAEQVERKWLRYTAYVLTVLGGVAVILSCILLPTFEDQALEFKRQRSLGKQRPTTAAS